MKILVTGGRDYNDQEMVNYMLDQINEYAEEKNTEVTHVIHGDAPGADTLADNWAGANGVQQVRCPANWDFYKKAAGPMRNREMLLLKPDLVVAFPGGTGTENMVGLATRHGYKVWKPLLDGQSIFDYMKQFSILDELSQ